MATFRFVHAGDLHLDSPFAGVGEVNEEVASQLREATFQAFGNVVDLCLQISADFVVIAGDIYDGQDRSLRAQLSFRDQLRRLSNQGVQMFVVHGNHDPLDGWAATLEWPPGVHIFGGNAVTSVPIERDGQVLARIYGISYLTREVRTNLVQRFVRETSDEFAIGLLHCNVGTDTGHEPYAPCTLEDLSRVGMDYWALGHVHKPAVLHDPYPTIVYAGNSQGRNPTELGPRGCFVVDVDDGRTVTATFVPVDVIRWYWETLPIDEIASEDELLRSLENLCGSVIEKAEGRSAVCRITLTGRGILHGLLNRTGIVADLTARLRENEGSRSPFLWVERIEAETSAPIDYQAWKDRVDFGGELLRLADSYKESSEVLTELRARLNELYGHAGFRRYLSEPRDEDLKEWVGKAAIQITDLLAGEED